MPSPQRVAERAMQKMARGETLLVRLLHAQMSYIEDTYEVLLGHLKQKYGQVKANYKPVGGVLPETTYKFRKPGEFYDVEVVVRIIVGDHSYLNTWVFYKGKQLTANLRPDLTPDGPGKLLAGQVSEIIG